MEAFDKFNNFFIPRFNLHIQDIQFRHYCSRTDHKDGVHHLKLDQIPMCKFIMFLFS